MAIRKTGAVTGRVTEVEQAPQPGISVTASAPRWDESDEQDLADENGEAGEE